MSLNNFTTNFPPLPDRTQGQVDATYFDRQWGYIALFVQAVTNKFNEIIKQLNSTPQGFTGTITTAKITGGGANGSMTFTNGVLTSQTPAT